MFGNIQIQRRNNRKLRLSNWFASERDGDMQAFNLDGVASGLSVWFGAVKRERATRRAARGLTGTA